MHPDKFNEIVKARLEKIEIILGEKAKEYAPKNDRFHNFNVAARISGTTPEKALYGMMLKHEVSVLDLIEMAENEPDKLNEALIDEKIGDNIDYLILLEGLLKQRCWKNKPPAYKSYTQHTL
ncbi:MAG: hypothetical protein DRH26_02200 [Deltaproteobacteria bacterium]|nr:MAG: hypothetical protein DRH26_02200 [Deltaproteobacteria bacterium]